MGKVLVTESYLEDIGDAIREQNGEETQYKPAEMANAILDLSVYPEPTGTKSITANGTGIDVKDYASADVNVPNSYSASDEGKVVSNGALVAQTSDTVTQNDTYDTTLINELTVNVSGGGGGGQGALVEPSFQGLSYCYMIANGEEFWTDTTKNQYLSVFEVKANHAYALFVGENVGSRRRAGFFSGKDISDFEPYLEVQPSSQQMIFNGAVWLAPFSKAVDDTGNALAGRIIYTPSSDGVIVYGTDNVGQVRPSYCVDMSITIYDATGVSF